MWAGSHPDYSATSSASTRIAKLGGGNHTSESNTKKYVVQGDTVTFAYVSDGSNNGDGYGYYAVVTASLEYELISGTYEIPSEPSNNYAFEGWSINQDGSGTIYSDDEDVEANIEVDEGATLYAKWEPLTYEITLENGEGASAGTTAIYQKYGVGFYLQNTDGNPTGLMSTTDNGITVPSSDTYAFGGYYTEENGAGVEYIDKHGKLTSLASATNFEAAGTLYAKWVPHKEIKYAVQIYGINQDVDSDNNQLGLTFGPATGADYNNSYVTHDYVETSEGSGIYNVKIITHTVAADLSETTSEEYLKNSSGVNVTRTAEEKEKYNINMHELTWTEIAEVPDKTVFKDCMLCGDTKSVRLTLNDSLETDTEITQYGDGAGSLGESINEFYRKWNPNVTQNSAVGSNVSMTDGEREWGSNAREYGAYSTSHVRASLIGKENSNPTIGFAGDDNLSEDNCIYSCIESDLQDVITAKKVKYVTGYSTGSYTLNSNIADKIWLFSAREVYGVGDIAGYTSEGLGTNGVGYSKFSDTESKSYMSAYSDNGSLKRIAYAENGEIFKWWLRSVRLDHAIRLHIVRDEGNIDIFGAQASQGISFGFCIQ